MEHFVEIVAALLVLGAFAGAQLGRLDQHKVPYLTLNLVGTAVLAWLAGFDRPGFLLLEGVWALISGFALAAVLRRRSAVESA